MENKKIIGILIITFGLISLFVFVYFIFFYNSGARQNLSQELPKKTSQQEQTAPIKPEAKFKEREENKNIIKEEKKEFGDEDLKRMAASFAERFGSYSNHSSFSNIVELKIFMTKNMQAWADKYVSEKQQQENYQDTYYGISTIAVLEKVKTYDEKLGKAEILVTTQRKESIGDTANSKTFSQDILITFKKQGGIWKVDSALWQEE